jgi:hypothetical protein
MGLPESGTQHATSTDFALPVDGSTDPLTTGTPPPARPTPPAYDEPADLLGTVPDVTTELDEPTPAYDALAAESGYLPYEPAPSGAAAVLAKVKAFAEERPAAFLAGTLVAGWLVGKLLSSDDAEDGG